MLNLEPKPEFSSPSKSDEDLSINIKLTNPFPGLRPFEIGENHLFFGRGSHADQILEKLSDHRFVSVLGYSGSGKSSLIHCGVVPTVYGGFVTEVGGDWTVISSRPGDDPLGNLANAIISSTQDTSQLTEHEIIFRTKAVKSILKSGPQGIQDAIKHHSSSKRTNYLLVIDQFEEIFRYRQRMARERSVMEETSQFVDLVVNANSHSDNVYVAITMRSDFVGDCSIFPGLTELINKSNFLVPRMSRDQKMRAIAGPIAVGGGRISQRLFTRLMEDFGDNQDQLPILQHALMRTWNYWLDNRDDNEPIDLRHYNAVGKISGALSQHADEIYDELTEAQKKVAEVLFKELTQKGADNKGLRRPAKLSHVAELARTSHEEVIEVIEAFRKPGRSFLMPGFGVPLDANSIIEISHESLMRIWVRLKNWVDEEAESAQTYLRISEAAEMYQVGKTGLWRPPDLQLALEWQKKQKPNRLWAQRYDEAFERAITFLDTSRITYEAEQKNQEMGQQRLLRRTRIAAITLGIALIIAIVFFIFGVIQQQQAEYNLIQAENNLQESIRQQNIAEAARFSADSAAKEAEKQRELAVQRSNELDRANDQLEKAVENLRVAVQQERIAQDAAEQERDRALEQTKIAQTQKQKADSASQIAQENFEEASRLLYLLAAQSMAAKSVNVEDTELQALLAMQAYQFNKQYSGRPYDPYVYNALHATNVSMEGQTFNTMSAHQNSVTSVSFPNNSDIFFSTGVDGKVVRNTFDKRESQVLSNSRYRNKIIAISNNAEYMVTGGDSTFVNLFKIGQNTELVKRVRIHKSYINDIHFLPDNETIISTGGDNSIVKTNILTEAITTLYSGGTEYKVMDVSPDGKTVLAGGLKGELSLINVSNGSVTELKTGRKDPVFAVGFNPKGDLLAFGDESGHSEIWNVASQKVMRVLAPHRARVSDVEFSDDGQLLATASWDQTVNIWVLEELNELPMTLTDNDAWVMDIDFSPDSGYLLAACNDGEIRIWTTKSDELAQGLCNKIKRNMTMEEWENYIGNDIPFKNTCVDKLMEQ